MHQIKLRKEKPRVNLAQAQALAKLSAEFKTAHQLGACETSLFALATKGLAEYDRTGSMNLFRRRIAN